MEIGDEGATCYICRYLLWEETCLVQRFSLFLFFSFSLTSNRTLRQMRSAGQKPIDGQKIKGLMQAEI